METTTKKSKITYSKNEKALRIITYIGIVLCEITAILLFFLVKYIFASIVLLSCAISSFLVSSFFTSKIKCWFGNKERKRLIYTLFYSLIILICMVTTIIICLNIGYSISELAPIVIEQTEAEIKGENINISNFDTEIEECYELNDSYYFYLYTEFDVKSDVGTISKESKITYAKINKYTSKVEWLDFISYENAKTYLK